MPPWSCFIHVHFGSHELSNSWHASLSRLKGLSNFMRSMRLDIKTCMHVHRSSAVTGLQPIHWSPIWAEPLHWKPRRSEKFMHSYAQNTIQEETPFNAYGGQNMYVWHGKRFKIHGYDSEGRARPPIFQIQYLVKLFKKFTPATWLEYFAKLVSKSHSYSKIELRRLFSVVDFAKH